MIKLDIKVGDTIMIGKFKNKKVTVKTITYDEHGMPIINGRPACTFRIYQDSSSSSSSK
jgi:hypothetical protein